MIPVIDKKLQIGKKLMDPIPLPRRFQNKTKALVGNCHSEQSEESLLVVFDRLRLTVFFIGGL